MSWSTATDVLPWVVGGLTLAAYLGGVVDREVRRPGPDLRTLATSRPLRGLLMAVLFGAALVLVAVRLGALT